MLIQPKSEKLILRFYKKNSRISKIEGVFVKRICDVASICHWIPLTFVIWHPFFDHLERSVAFGLHIASSMNIIYQQTG